MMKRIERLWRLPEQHVLAHHRMEDARGRVLVIVVDHEIDFGLVRVERETLDLAAEELPLLIRKMGPARVPSFSIMPSTEPRVRPLPGSSAEAEKRTRPSLRCSASERSGEPRRAFRGRRYGRCQGRAEGGHPARSDNCTAPPRRTLQSSISSSTRPMRQKSQRSTTRSAASSTTETQPWSSGSAPASSTPER